MRISILMPVKNAQPFLRECIGSILDQTETDWELLAVDDGSADSSYATLQEFAQTDPRITVLKNKGSGIIDALRSAYSKCRGTFITRMDADDVMLPQKLEILKRNLVSFGKGHLAIGQVNYFSETELGDGYRKYETWLNALASEGKNYADIYRECVIPSPCWMAFREDLEKCDAFHPTVYPEDYDLCFRFYREKLKPIPCSDILHLWRDHPDRSSRNDENYADNRFLELKVKWFLELDHDPTLSLVVWGAGAKGKAIAKLLIERVIPFRWACNNPKKVGKHIYGVEMESSGVVNNGGTQQVIVAVANAAEQAEIRRVLKEDVFFFC